MSRTKLVRGDFQPPVGLAREVCALLLDWDVAPSSIVEPTCGTGGFLAAALDAFPAAGKVLGMEIDGRHAAAARKRLRGHARRERVRVRRGDFFATDWDRLVKRLPEPLLVLGNPPWVTNAALGKVGAKNLPKKTNRGLGLRGIEAMTGKSNFDISEWMICRGLDWLAGRRGTLAMLCKTQVARKVLRYAWSRRLPTSRTAVHVIDAGKHFDAAVDACLLIVQIDDGATASRECPVFQGLTGTTPIRAIGWSAGRLLADADAWRRRQHLASNGKSAQTPWRSGIKHDCAPIMELTANGTGYHNGLGELVELEPQYLFPLLKSSHVHRGLDANESGRVMVVPQRRVGEPTEGIREQAPATWAYLQGHAERLGRRRSSIYKGQPRFAIFGVGDYTFAPWKVATSGFYKQLEFRTVGPAAGKPVVFDDTCYFVPCRSEAEAKRTARLLGSEAARDFFSALIFWDAKRPITIERLRRLDLAALAREVGGLP